MAAPTLPDPNASWSGTWARPADHPGQIALALGCGLLIAALVPGAAARLISALDFLGTGESTRRRRFLVASGLAAAFLSIAYVDAYLHGGPRALEAPVYWLQGRMLSRGSLAWVTPSPLASYRATGMLSVFPDRVCGIFPPGYPLLLAAGFLVGAPMLVGALVSGGLVVATWFLARELATQGPDKNPLRWDQAASLAAGLSFVCAALKQQTADVLPHGAVALGIATVVTSSLVGMRTRKARFFLVAGFGLGWLVSARPMAAVIVGAMALGLLSRSSRPWQALTVLATSALPGTALLLAANHAATGHAFVLPSSFNLAFAGEPAGALVGARHPVQWIIGDVRRHLMDVANFEPLALGLLFAVTGARRTRTSLLLLFVVAGQLVVHPWKAQSLDAYGAADLTEALPLEHALLGYGLAATAGSSFQRVALGVLGLALAGFGIHASNAHAAMGASDLGRPHFEPDALIQANVTSPGLLFFDDDQGFELASVPWRKANQGLQVARLRSDDHDRMVYEAAGHPSAHRYKATTSGATITPWSPPNPSALFWRFEAESDWPPIAITGGRADVVSVKNSCASGANVLTLSPAGPAAATAILELPVPAAPTAGPTGNWSVTPRIYLMGQPAEGSLDVMLSMAGPPIAHWAWRDEGDGSACRDLNGAVVELGRGRDKVWLVLSARRGKVALDRTMLR